MVVVLPTPLTPQTNTTAGLLCFFVKKSFWSGIKISSISLAIA
jgi:hypothetical protein